MTTPALGLPARLMIAAASLVLYTAAFALPALRFTYDNGEVRVMPGWEAAFLGWAALLVYNFGWLANFVYVPGVLLVAIGWWTLAAAFGVTAALLALQSLMLFGVTMAADEGGVRKMSLTGLEAGYFAWLTAIAAIAIGSIWALRRPAS
jgi:hypothetical protein